MILSRWILVAVAALLPAMAQAQPAHSAQQGGGLLFHYGVVPAEVVLAHAEGHAEREMHQGKAKRGTSHVVLALFEANDGQRVADAQVILHLTLSGGPSATTKLEPMTIAGQVGYGGFVSMSAPGTYRLRFEARRPSVPGSAHVEFDHRVPGPERGR